MANENPALNEHSLPWYRGLSRYQYWVLIIAAMGWMFDTMDQQFFNIARGPALQQILGYDPTMAGKKALGRHAPHVYDGSQLDALAAEGLLTPAQKTQLLADASGRPRAQVEFSEVARAIGETLLTPRFVELGEAKLNEKGVSAAAFDEAALKDLVGKNLISGDVAEKQCSPRTWALTWAPCSPALPIITMCC